MTMRVILGQIVLLSAVTFTLAADDKSNAAKAKKGLQEIGEFIGQWNLQGETRTNGKLSSWKETSSWGWKFKGDDAWIAVEIKDGRFFSKGELRFDPATKKYKFKLSDKDGKASDFTGDFKRGKMTLEHKNAESGNVEKLVINTISEGVRLMVQYEVQEGGKGIFSSVFKAAGNKEGESFAGGAGAKKPECIVTGGTGTMTVSYMGKTYYVCCSGCRDEFNDNPKKYVDAFEKGKK